MFDAMDNIKQNIKLGISNVHKKTKIGSVLCRISSSLFVFLLFMLFILFYCF